MCQKCVHTSIKNILDESSAQLEQHGCINSSIGPVARLKGCDIKVSRKLGDNARMRKFIFPANSQMESKRTTCLLRTLSFIRANFECNKVATIRDLYYLDVSLFERQDRVVRCINRICRCLGVTRRDLNIVPSPNGLVVGDMVVHFKDGKKYTISRENGPTLIPVGSLIERIELKSVPEFVVVVEKEAVFSHLASTCENSVAITGKGFPDHYTREFLCALTNACPKIPVFGLVDSDVHGILIMRTFKTGSDCSLDVQAPIENMFYIGVSIIDYKEGLVSTTVKDAKLSLSTMRKTWIREPYYSTCRNELQRSIFMGKKAEMNLIDQQGGRLADYLRHRVTRWRKRQTAELPYIYSSKRPRIVQHDPMLAHALTMCSVPEIEIEMEYQAIPTSEQVWDDASCPICRTEAAGSWVECTVCFKWLHVKCVGLELQQAEKMQGFRCDYCKEHCGQ